MPFGLADFHLTLQAFRFLFFFFFFAFCCCAFLNFYSLFFASLLLFCFHCGSPHVVVAVASVVLGNSIFCHGFWANFKWLTYIYMYPVYMYVCVLTARGCQWIPLVLLPFHAQFVWILFLFCRIVNILCPDSIGSPCTTGKEGKGPTHI